MSRPNFPDPSMPTKPTDVRAVGNRVPALHDIGDGRLLSAAGIAQLVGISDKAMYDRLKRGLTGNALLAPAGSHVARYEIDGAHLTVAEIAARVGVGPVAIYYRLSRGYRGKALLARSMRRSQT